MSTKREIIYSVYERLRMSSDDKDMSEEFISSLVDSKRAMLLTQRYSKNPWNIPNEIKTELCLELELASNIDGMTCFGKILRTKEKLPKTINIKGKVGPLTVRKYDRTSIHINIIPLERMPFVGHNSFVSQMIYAAYDFDGRLYFVSNQKKHHLLKHIRVTDIWEDPDKAFELNCHAGEVNSCEAWDNEYPLEKSMQDEVITMIVKELAASLGIPEDDTNDASSKIEPDGRR